MLVLSRKKGEAVVIGKNIRIVICEIGENSIRLGIEAPRAVPIMREELLIDNGDHEE